MDTNRLIQEQVAAQQLRVSLASYLSQMNGKSIGENIQDAIALSLITSFSVTEVLELAIDQQKLLDRFAVGQYNLLDNQEKEITDDPDN